MAYDGWLEYNDVELVNVSRTVQLAAVLGIDSVVLTPESVQWIQDDLGGVGYDVLANAPWHDAGYPASEEFAGIIPLGFPGLDDSTTQASTIEYITDGGRSGKQRNSTLSIVGSVALIASTERGAEYGKRWMDRVLRNAGSRMFCAGVTLRYFRYASTGAPIVHRRNVALTRGASITRKRSADCSVTWMATFTLSCDDPYEYSVEQEVLNELGGTPTSDVIDSGSLVLIQETCPVYDYTPVYDPLYPALVASPTAPDFYPAGWTIGPGDTFERFWARVTSPEPNTLAVVPVFLITTDIAARMVRVSIWPSDSATDDQCDPLFSAVVSYLPADTAFYIDGEQKASYTYDGLTVRRTDSLVYAPDANPVEWTSFNDTTSLLVTLDIFSDSAGYEGDGDVRVALGLVSKSD